MIDEAGHETPFIIRGTEYDNLNGPTHEQLKFLGRLAEKRGENFKFSEEEIANIKTLENKIKNGEAVLVGGLAVAAVYRDEIAENLSSGADYGAGLLNYGVRVGNKAYVGDGAYVGLAAYVGYFANVGDGAYVGDGVRVGEFAHVGNWAYVGDGARICNYAYVGDGARICNYAYVGDGVRVGEFAHVGNWAYVGDGAQVGHRVQVGNSAQIGRRVQIGNDAQILVGTIIPEEKVMPDGAVAAPKGTELIEF